MVNSVKKNTNRVSKIVKPLVSVDWTKVEGDTPFFEQASSAHSGRYAVGFTTNYNEFLPDKTGFIAARDSFITGGVSQILDFYNKNPAQVDSVAASASIPGFSRGSFNASGTYVPLRPSSSIRVFVTIPDIIESNNKIVFSFDKLEDKPPEIYGGAYYEIQLNSFRLSQKAEKAAKLLEKFDKQANAFEGRVYNLDFKREAEKIRNFVPTLQKLIQNNGFVYSEAQSDLIMLGMASSYAPLYAQINQGDGFNNLSIGFSQFKKSKFTDNRTMFLYKSLDDMVEVAKQKSSIKKEKPGALDVTAKLAEYGICSDGDGKLSSPQGWQDFSQKYIKCPPAIIEYSTGRAKSPAPDSSLVREIAKADAKTIKDPDTLKQESWRLQQKEFKKEMAEKRKKAKEFIGDNVLGNLNETIHKIESIEDTYRHILNKLGITYIVKAAIECAEINLPIDCIKDFLLDAKKFLEDVIQILEIPTLTLDDLIPTVDIMADIGKQVLLAIGEAVKKALVDMVKQLIQMILEACGDPNKLNFGGMPLVSLIKDGPGDRSALDVIGVIGEETGVFDGIKQGIRNTGVMQTASRDFLKNINAFVSNDALQKLAADGFKPVSDLLDQVSAALTPGEVAKLLQGKATQDSIKIIQTVLGPSSATACVDAVVGAGGVATAPDNRDATQILQDLLSDEDKINDFFSNVGKVVDEDEVLKQIEDLERIIPETSVGLCDLDDSALRCELLKGKGLGEAECQEHIQASEDRQRQRINELADILKKDNPLDGAIPPVYCTFKDGELQEGMIPKDHPSFDFMLDTTLDTSFAGIYNSFTQDVAGVPKLMSREAPDGVEDIPRTIPWSAARGGTSTRYGFRLINPDFKAALGEGYVPSPPFVEVGPFDDNDGDDSPNDAAEAREDTTKLGENMEWAARKTIEINHRLPPLQRPKTKTVVTPGLAPDGDAPGDDQGAFGKFQTSLDTSRISEDDNRIARSLLYFDNRGLQIVVENPTKTDLQNFGLRGAGGTSLFDAFSSEIGRSPKLRNIGSSILGVDRYAILYKSFAEAEDSKDKFSVFLKADGANLYQQTFNLDVSSKTLNVVASRNLFTASLDGIQSRGEQSQVEKRFVGFLSNILDQGEKIYVTASNGSTLSVAEPYVGNIIGGVVPEMFSNSLLENMGKTAVDEPRKSVKSLYEELLRDLSVSCMEEAKKSMLLEEDVFRLLNLTPTGCDGENQKDPMLLDLDDIKSKVKKRYKNSQCIKSSAPNTSGLGDNRDNALEQSIIYGNILVTVRTYALEAVLKALVTFSRLNIEEVDEVFVSYVRDNLMDEIREKGYLNDFMQQVLKSYNDIENPTPRETNPTVALDWFVRGELKFAVDKLLKVAGQNSPTARIDNLLFNRTTTGHGGLFPFFDVMDKATSTTSDYRRNEAGHLDDYHVDDIKKNVGIKDWRNGNFYLEKYIRSDLNYDGMSDDEQNTIGVKNFRDDGDQPYNGVCNLSKFIEWCNSKVNKTTTGTSTTTQGQTTTPTTTIVTVPETVDCAPGQDIEIPGVLAEQAGTTTATIENPLSRYFSSLRVGVRLVCQVCHSSGESLSDSAPVWNLPYSQGGYSWSPQGDVVPGNAKLNKAYLVTEKVGTTALRAFTFPIVCAEKEIDLRTPIGSIPDVSTWFNKQYDDSEDELYKILKDSDEYSFMFDYCFPLNRLVSLTALYNSTFLLPYPGLSDAFKNTKEQMRVSFLSMLNSGNYQYKDLAWTPEAQANAAINGGEIPGFNFAEMGAKLMLAIFRSLGEMMSPNISIARKIQMASEMVGNQALDLADKLGLTEEQKCAQANQFPEIPIALLSLMLLPMDLIPPPPMGPGIGPPLGGMGYAYLPLFGMTRSGPFGLLASETDKIKERCALRAKLGQQGLVANRPPLSVDCEPKK